MRRLPPLSALRAFEAAARHGSFKRAASELAVTPTAISHQIRSLEEHTRLTLFERKVRKVVLSDAGVQLYPVLRDGFDAFEAMLDRLSQSRKRAQVTISATNAFTVKWLVPRMANFRKLHPDIDLQLQASDEAVDLDGRSVDIAIRYGQGSYPGLRSEPMFADEFAPLANPRLGVRDPADLSRFSLIHFEWIRKRPGNPNWQNWFAKAGLPCPSDLGQLQFSDESHAIQAAVAGQGVALLSLALVADELAAGHLMQPFGPKLDGYTYHLVMKGDGSPSSSVSAAADWLRSEVRSARAR
ncbi:LysR substrate-binding domain-containing protein [Bradyrhizobium sp. LHD-71]|uniref:LysR substrate-binding domain-containing protein n=1 Tax=Bradyrhizobium sp. LHD-71 TaxID=3072141 RepID=UPI00280C91FF|nr:LysR substrate-binding domain-containing protein [Bradyrhizobium sp. LHD-71]MDQ8731914.1 LysR substrate-binding domain-containing protein [Bradyrhizobium sp. LHD-71]